MVGIEKTIKQTNMTLLAEAAGLIHVLGMVINKVVLAQQTNKIIYFF